MNLKSFGHWVLIVVTAVALQLLLELAIEYLWLGRHWSPGRLWIDLTTVSLIVVAATAFVIKFVDWRYLLLVTVCFSGLPLFIPWLFLDPLFINPSIRWQGGQQTAYIAGIMGIGVLVSKWAWYAIKAARPGNGRAGTNVVPMRQTERH